MTDGLRRMRHDELERADELLVAAYESPSRRRELELYLASQPDGWFVVEEQGELVAVAGCVAFGSFCWLGFVGTHPDARGRGLATRLSQHAVDWARGHGCRTIALDASDLGRPVYHRLGFVHTGWTVQLVADPLQPLVEGPRAERAGPGDVDRILAIDPPFFGGDRSVLLRGFADRFAEGCFVTRDAGGELSGYLFAREHLIGPGVAPDVEGAAALVRAAIDLPGDRSLLVPAGGACLGALRELGLVEQRRLAHMRLGELELPGRRDRLIAQLSFATG